VVKQAIQDGSRDDGIAQQDMMPQGLIG
jgi:hypothetical protein